MEFESLEDYLVDLVERSTRGGSLSTFQALIMHVQAEHMGQQIRARLGMKGY